MLWVTDFPLFEREEEGEKEADNSSGNDGGDGGAAMVTAQPWTPVHHPFTAPMPSDMEKLFGEDCAIAKITGQHYDLVCNGMEVGGGSVRIHDPVAQRHVLERILGLGTDATEQSFGHLLESLQEKLIDLHDDMKTINSHAHDHSDKVPSSLHHKEK